MKIFTLANILTLGNVVSGCIGITLVFQGHLEWGAYMVWIGAVFDFFDGFAARLTKTSSPIGKELDSLADMVTFGVLPGVVVYTMLRILLPGTLWPFAGFIIPAFSALRLAKFNVDDRQTTGFIGMPTPASTLFLTALPLVVRDNIFGLGDFVNTPWFLITISVVFCLLMISEIPMLAMKFKDYSLKNNIAKYLFILIAVSMLAILQLSGVPAVILVYILFSIIVHFTSKKENPSK
ncbi:phosphatidylserine synthase [Fulvitalea axinellae]|uniref:CDP-diacylglycerol--serine O-phosphatidyltransferase n=1 Tax=Fulvitalea axinellae TaxID=1182444 RepID=A0AAU9CLV8_9BACT|nr:phosphatidylserine synthase [Fulvitalea axinellae]